MRRSQRDLPEERFCGRSPVHRTRTSQVNDNLPSIDVWHLEYLCITRQTKFVSMIVMTTRTLLCTLVLATAANAQLLHNAVQAEIPFAFSVPGIVVPPGTYRIEQPNTITGQRTLLMTNMKTNRSVLLVQRFTDTRAPEAPTEMVFRCLEQKCELAEIWVGGGIGWNFGPSRSKLPDSAFQVARVPIRTAARAQAD